ncbi:hypothetical protein CVD28_03460 [Bacillus sp. M6-12]|uniref:hypothetical protein n=1 Tax=Bacillus sp. M6-12 TaxID=2054166 RepID=UPI000C76A578|nr:hypothetical protein [Bacillus sp. M6-12]PLS19487.1 hypothetical protein CVD28_03460 [Bacillus sp. M6-12]
MKIANYIFQEVKYFNKPLQVNFVYEVIRPEENSNEIHVTSYSKEMRVKEKTFKFITEKTDEEIKSYFDNKFKEYEEKLSKQNFIGSGKTLAKFGREFQLFFK